MLIISRSTAADENSNHPTISAHQLRPFVIRKKKGKEIENKTVIIRIRYIADNLLLRSTHRAYMEAPYRSIYPCVDYIQHRESGRLNISMRKNQQKMMKINNWRKLRGGRDLSFELLFRTRFRKFFVFL